MDGPQPAPGTPSGRILVPLYSDGYSFSMLAITDDGGKTWSSSEPIVSMGSIQPSLVRKTGWHHSRLHAEQRPSAQRVIRAESRDDGVTWSTPTYTDIPNPGSSMEVTGLREGLWVLIGNDTEPVGTRCWSPSRTTKVKPGSGGGTWSSTPPPTRPGSLRYPTLIQARDGSLHATYGYTPAA